MLQRSSFGFYKDLTVFPGGKLDASDADPRWKSVCNDPISTLSSAKIASLRETFEEVGLLLVDPPHKGQVNLSNWRSKSSVNSLQFLEMFQEEPFQNTKLDTRGLIYYSNWVSPEHFEKNRFDTKFFLKILPDSKVLDHISVDGRESVSIRLESPSDLLEAFRRRGISNLADQEHPLICHSPTANLEIQLLPPQYVTLLELSKVKSDDFAAFLGMKSRQKVSKIIPEVLGATPDGQAIMALPGDGMHSTSKDSSSLKLNRLHIRRKDGKVDSIILSSEPGFDRSGKL
jgi:8-oxo-dGTP pyrophosphatase MutT (NUDIX family)